MNYFLYKDYYYNFKFIYSSIYNYPLITTKSTRLIEGNCYSFAVSKQLSKTDIKQSIEYLFNVKVISINTNNPPVKKRKVGKFTGNCSYYKKAYVTLAPGSFIDLFVYID
uniref:Large ribosomal subunit protein uL23c n=1 Tax=Boldia erythrosiphon TaxID=74908 RepID=A0A1X9PV46_9RHOD|nr:50S ribosomal protein L23 [Boldia erythrosiphon]ARO90583.1 50S ribosomal protein L23 [Boldia erythrosiphon]